MEEGAACGVRLREAQRRALGWTGSEAVAGELRGPMSERGGLPKPALFIFF